MILKRPTFLIDSELTKSKIKNLFDKLANLDIELRPHFKTHNSIEVGSWFAEYGISKITVSSVQMAEKFLQAGWTDILIAFPVNILEIEEINHLNSRAKKLSLLIDNVETAFFLEKELKSELDVFVEIDTGKGRSGRRLEAFKYLEQIAKYLKKCRKLKFNGILTHAGNSYNSKSKDEIISINNISLAHMRAAKALFLNHFDTCKVSSGDTPTAFIADSFPGADELRPGVFVYFDLMMNRLGACKQEDISAYVSAPICGVYPERKENNLLLYCGAVHLSKEHLNIAGKAIHGKIEKLNHSNKIVHNSFHTEIFITQLSQVHAMCSMPKELLTDLSIGESLAIIPVHACLTANAMAEQYIL